MQMSNGWSYRQYMVFRTALGGYVAAHFASLWLYGAELFSSAGVLPAAASPLLRLFPNVLGVNDSPAVVAALLALGVVSGLAITSGRAERLAALAAWYVWACLFGRNPLISNPSLPYVGWMLLAHALIAPGTPSPEARRSWRIPETVYRAAWVVLAVGYSYSGLCKLSSLSWLDGSALEAVLSNPLARDPAAGLILSIVPSSLLKAVTWGALALEISFAPAVLSRRLRPGLWAAMLAMHVSLLFVLDFADLTWGMLLIHAFTFDPAWIKGRGAGVETVFFDGQCGLCQSWVQLVIEEDRREASFRFAPLGGKTFQELVPEAVRRGLPDSLVVAASDGRVLVKSRAVLHILRRLGGLWAIAAAAASLIPSGLADLAYTGVAKARRLWRFGVPVCRFMPVRLRWRMLG